MEKEKIISRTLWSLRKSSQTTLTLKIPKNLGKPVIVRSECFTKGSCPRDMEVIGGVFRVFHGKNFFFYPPTDPLYSN